MASRQLNLQTERLVGLQSCHWLAGGVVHINHGSHVVVVSTPGHFDQTRVDVYNMLRNYILHFNSLSFKVRQAGIFESRKAIFMVGRL